MDIQDEQKLAKAGDLREAENYGESSKEYTESLISLIDKQDYQARNNARSKSTPTLNQSLSALMPTRS
ncbi:MAG: hypothetical protein UW62_C0030G0005 [Candidatus Collierbacteria bacterium GW2011_GWB1_44_35]|uniref:Uncharacterized protein n=1 Tax=Candidatus Collierbacteria bacterium GW2011_GWB1_44_35 TaxID=1618383 RepID=A0A0G1J770_9BACT|nr:MAG: hypothetical protein UW62_C0030G0005 [Candidatus Collierbacteria bacterium GW2011_GWB1_44_35]